MILPARKWFSSGSRDEDPSPAQITQMTKRIRAHWSPSEHLRRLNVEAPIPWEVPVIPTKDFSDTPALDVGEPAILP